MITSEISLIMRPSSLGGGRIMRRTLSVRPSVCLSVCPSVPLSLPSVTSRHLANYNDTCTFRHALRAAYRTAISAAQILVMYCVNNEGQTYLTCSTAFFSIVYRFLYSIPPVSVQNWHQISVRPEARLAKSSGKDPVHPFLS